MPPVWRFEDDPKQSLLIETAQIWMERLSFANHGWAAGELGGEGVKAAVRINVVNNDGAAGTQKRPGAVQLEEHVAFAVQAIVDKDVNLILFREKRGKAPAARAFNVCPVFFESFSDGSSYLRAKRGINGWKVNAPEVAT